MSKTTVDELKTLYVKLGGNIADVATVQTDAEMIDKIEDIVEVGGALPEVTAEDNGDILGVVEGAWAKTTSKSAFVTVNATLNETTVTLDDGVTVADVKALVDAVVDAGGNVRIKLSPSDSELTTGSLVEYYYFSDIYKWNTNITYHFTNNIGTYFNSYAVKAADISLNITNNEIRLTRAN